MRAAVLALCLVLAMTACSGPGAEEQPSAPPAEQLAAFLADGLADGRADGRAKGPSRGLGFVGPSPDEAGEALERIGAGMGVQPQVEVADVRTSGDTASVRLAWSWIVGGEPWTYDTTAELRRSGQAWRVVWSPALVEPSLTPREVLRTTAVAADRGDITGAGGATLVTDRPVVRFGIDKSLVRGRVALTSARKLAALLGIDTAPYVEQVDAFGDAAFVEGIVFRRNEVPTSVQSSYDQIPGAASVSDRIPLAPTKEFAAPVLGTVGPVTAEIVEESDGEYAAGDVAGLSGLQERYDDRLGGADGVVVEAVRPDDTARRLFQVQATDGEALVTTLDPGLQTVAEQALAGIGPPSALVAIRPSTGDVLAAASGPGSAGYNTATFGQYAPGSTFKVVSSLALLRAGLEPRETVACPATTTVDGKIFENYDDYPPSALGDITFRTAVAQSCNTAFIAQRGRLDPEALAEAAAALGLGVDHDLGFPAYFGQVPPAESETDSAARMIGQGKVLASPMAMAGVVASVVRGRTVLPRLLPEQQPPQKPPASPLDQQEAADLRGLMRGVVETGSGSFLAGLSGPPVLAKTGTAEYGGSDGTGRLRTHAWMVGAQGDLAVAVFVETGASGSRTAGPILEEFLRRVG